MAGSTSSVLWAEWRRGLKDLQNAVLNPFNGVTQTHEEPATIANPTPQLVTADIRGEQDFNGIVADYSARPSPAKERAPER